MPVLQSGNSPSARVANGDAILEAAATVNTAPIKARLAAFVRVHKDYIAAEKAVRAAEDKESKQQAKIGAADVTQDGSVDQLANGLAGDGLPRLNPLKPLGFKSPSEIKKMGTAEEADTILELAEAVRKRPGLSKQTLDKAKAAEKAATAVNAELEKLPPLTKAKTAALTRRDALALPWEKQFAALKRAARAAEDEGHAGLFAALFQSTAPAAKPRKARAEKTPPKPAAGAGG